MRETCPLVHQYQDLIHIFNQTFFASFNTRLVKGGDEPLYLPAHANCHYHQIIFAHGYFASALHEIAHWCIAGEQRRLLVDFGYWYEPDGRTTQQQRDFEKVEVKPQAIEWGFSLACGKPFRVSVDNLNGESGDTTQFEENVFHQLQAYRTNGFPHRAHCFIQALQAFYDTPEQALWQVSKPNSLMETVS